MSDDAAAIRLPFHARIRAGLRHVHNWAQLLRFMAVGASGYVVNLAVFALVVHLVDGSQGRRIAAVVAFVVALANNFFWNRHWAFDARDGHAGFQAARYVVVSLVAFGCSFVILELLANAGLPDLAAQAIAIVVATPVNFLGNKLWSFAD